MGNRPETANGARQQQAPSIALPHDRILECAHPRIMGIINCTPDSFAVRHSDTASAVRMARTMIDEGADILDIGGESSRPGSEPVSVAEELARILPVIELIREFSDIPLSIDTTKAAVAEKALTLGCDIINDISGLGFDPDMAPLAAEYNCPIVIMHIRGTPKTMQEHPEYDDVIKEVGLYFTERMALAEEKGIPAERIILDVGIGFGKRRRDNLALLKHHGEFRRFGRPLLLGASRKRFIGSISRTEGDDRIDGSLAVAAIGVMHGADIIRTHDVAHTRRAVALATAIREV